MLKMRSEAMIKHEGKWYARVTEVLQPYTDFGHIDPKVLKNKCDIGTRVHEAIENYINENRDGAMQDDVRGYFKSFHEWSLATECEILYSEERYYDHTLRITGKIDSIINLGNGLPVLVDYKTSAAESPITWPMQAHLYFHLLKVNDIDVEPRFLFLKLDKNGRLPKVFEYKYSDNRMAGCIAAVKDFWEPKDF